MDADKPSESLIALAAELGPLFEVRRVLGSRYVVATGADIV